MAGWQTNIGWKVKNPPYKLIGVDYFLPSPKADGVWKKYFNYHYSMYNCLFLNKKVRYTYP